MTSETSVGRVSKSRLSYQSTQMTTIFFGLLRTQGLLEMPINYIFSESSGDALSEILYFKPIFNKKEKTFVNWIILQIELQVRTD